MRSIPAAVALLMVGLTISSIAALFFKSGSPSEPLFLKSGSPSEMAQGEVRCEGAELADNVILHGRVKEGW